MKKAADFVAESLAYLFNLTVEKNEIPSGLKSAFVVPLLKGGDPAILTYYRPISNLSMLAIFLEAFMSAQLKVFLHSSTILLKYQSDFRNKKNMVPQQLH